MTAATEARTMRAAIFEGPGRLVISERPIPQLHAPDDVLIEVEACGVCGTDVHILSDPPGHPGTPGCVLGHEFVGRVRGVGAEARDVAVGDRVVVAPNLSCGTCAACKKGLTAHCERFTTIGIFRDGGMASHVVVPALACHQIADDLPAQVAALVEPLSCVFNGIQQAKLVPGETVVVIGAGAIGLMFLALLRAGGASRVVVVEPGELRRGIALEMGADYALDPRDAGFAEAVENALGGAGADVVVDAVGSQLPAAIELAAPRGRVLLFGMDAHARGALPQVEITRRELVVFGTYVGDHTFPDTIRVLESGVIDLAPLVSHWVSLEELPETLDEIRGGSAVKAVIDLTRGA
ncbi:L-threonine dehydrogenase [Conexibacter woesei]|uniref:Alcohol dehydrogenase GroES domain protein n=1 Tax=Conexibacter woesei (strain DSM 14684 / CCUG 47730 / CIP 108061 / JCM 11494 / NBRC 100937 / ID131577) TaxID=469383 RepID=D3EZL4_CONWI|nr:L-threonine dehydrogenase [Conexibacter woesei]ADB53852.1 Alcohol dehydrogenase GroES domain protein [Conexibacter woesei DSM 14684]